MMEVQHVTHKKDEWFDIIDEDPDCDWQTGKYIGLHNMLKLSDGRWYPQGECYYMSPNGERKSCLN